MAITWETVEQILKTTRTIAVVGLSDKSDRESYQVAAYLQMAGYRIIPVNPRVQEVLGEQAYSDLRQVPEKVDVVQVFRRSEDVPPIVDDAIAIGARVVWMQVGIEHPEAGRKAEAAGLRVVMNACMRSAHRTLQGSRRR